MGLQASEGIILYIDGASRGNPGEAGIGVVLMDKRGNVIEEVSKYIGETTNNVAEYRALLEGLRRVLARGVANGVQIFSDSELLVRQIHGKYKVKAPSLLPLYKEVMRLLNNVPRWEIAHIRREENSRADALANAAIDQEKLS